MKARVVRTIFFKELLDTFRDRRTLIAMVGVPVVLYPALFILATQATLIQQSRMEKTRAKVAVVGEDASQIARALGELGADVVGVNCGVGPQAALDMLEGMTADPGPGRYSLKPNAGV